MQFFVLSIFCLIVISPDNFSADFSSTLEFPTVIEEFSSGFFCAVLWHLESHRQSHMLFVNIRQYKFAFFALSYRRSLTLRCLNRHGDYIRYQPGSADLTSRSQ